MTGTAPSASGAGVRLRLQNLPPRLQVLAIGDLAALRSADGTFRTSEVEALRIDLRLPPWSNLSSVLGRLRDERLLMRPTTSTWALTPRGEDELTATAAEVSSHGLAAQLGQTAGSEFAERKHMLIPPFLGPMADADGLGRLLDQAPFEQNVMLITRFPKEGEQPFADLIIKMRQVARAHGLNLIVASDAMHEDTLWGNVVTYMWAAKYAIVLMDTDDERLNYNVLIEIGGMLMTGRRCAILRDVSVPEMPTDLVGHIYKPTDLAAHDETLAVVHRWIRDDLGLGGCTACPPHVNDLAE